MSSCQTVAALMALIVTTVYARGSASPSALTHGEETEAAVRFHQTGNDVALLPSTHADGVRGEILEIESEPPPYTAALSDRRLDALRLFACTATVFGTAKLESATSFVGKNGAGIYTEMRFNMTEDWRADTTDERKAVDIVSRGGDAIWKGQRIRVTNTHTNFKVGGHYILVAGNRYSQKSDLIYEDLRFFEISGNAIFSAPGWTPFAQGSSVEQASIDVSKALVTRGCK